MSTKKNNIKTLTNFLYEVVTMCLFHDIPESRSGDQNWVHKKYVKVFEEEIIEDQLSNLPEEKNLKKTLKDYHDRESRESLIAKDADLIDQILLQKEYSMVGNKEALRWSKGKGSHEKMLYSESAKKLVADIKKTTPTEWWHNLWTSSRR